MVRFIPFFVLSEHCVQDSQQLAYTGNQRHFFGFSCGKQSHVKHLYYRVKAGCDKRCHVQGCSHTHGGLALIFVILAKILVLSELALRGEPILASLAAACAVSRGTAALLMYRHRYAREEGLGNVFIGKIDGRQTCVTLGLAAIFAAVLLPGMHGVAAMVVTMVAIFILGQLLKRTLGGQTGDTLGAAIELGELVFLLALL